MQQLEASLPAVGGGWARPCDSCRSAPCAVYCRADTAFLCADCDSRVHAANRVASRHERVWVCEACEQAPAAITCKADAAALCAACDADVHSANPLARRHHRVPILPISSEEVVAGGGWLRGSTTLLTNQVVVEEVKEDEVDDEAASWLLRNPTKNHNNNQSCNGYLFGGDVDEYLDLGEYNSCVEIQNQDQRYIQQEEQFHGNKYEGSDGIVPRPFTGTNELQQQQQNFHMEMGYEAPRPEFCYTTTSLATVSHCHPWTQVLHQTAP